MSNPSKRKGSGFEIDLREYALDRGYDITRNPTNGTKDIADLALRALGKHYPWEAKAHKSLDLAGWVKEAEVEADNYATLYRLDRSLVIPVVVAKKRMARIGDSYVIQKLDWWLDDHR